MIGRVLQFSARHGRYILVIGLLAGVALPDLAVRLRPWLQEFVAILMFLAALRIGPANALGAIRDFRAFFAIALVNQVILPLTLIVLFGMLGMLNTLVGTALILMAAASPISGSPNLTIMVKGDPVPSLRLLVISTAILPLTVIPVFYWVPALGSPTAVFGASARLLVVIGAATLLAFFARHFFLKEPKQATISAIDGCAAIVMAIMVVGLMSSVGSTLAEDPFVFFSWLALAFGVNFGLQFLAYGTLRRSKWQAERTAFSISTGNRNIALFLVALPNEIIDPVLLFIGCYQIPMYLTPILLKRLYVGRS